MGRPKAWLPWGDGTLVEHVVSCVSSVASEVCVVTSAELDLPRLDARIVRDREPERGPLAALRDGLSAIESEWAFVTSTDSPFLQAEGIEALFARGRACAPVDDGHVQVLHAVYPREAGELAGALLDEEVARPRALLDRLDFEALENEEALHGSSPRPWTGFNTPADYLEGVRAVVPDARAEVELLGRAALGHEDTLRSVPVGTLGEVLSIFESSATWVDGRHLRSAYLASLGGRDLTRDLDVPVGSGERISLVDAMAGG